MNAPASPPPPAIAPTRAVTKPLKDCTLGEAFQSPEFAERIKAGLPRHLNADSMLRTFVQATTRTPLILKCDPRQSIGAFLTLSQLGLQPNNAMGEAFLIPFQRTKWNAQTRQREVLGYDLNVVIGYKGYLTLAFRSGQVSSVHADVVYAGDDFDYLYGTRQFLEHRPTGKHPEGATPHHAYAVAQLKGELAGDPPFRVLPWSDVLATRNGSQAYRTALAAKENAEKQNWNLPATYTDAPWVKHVIPMAMKTAWLRLSTWVPRSLEMAGAQRLDETADSGGRVDFSSALAGGSIVEGTMEVDEPGADPDTAFGMRQRDDEGPEDPAPPSPPPPPPPPPPAAARSRNTPPAGGFGPQTAAKVSSWEGYAADENGELVNTMGNGGHFTDPVLFAEAIVKLATNPDTRAAVIETNLDSINEAIVADAGAAVLLQPLLTGTGTKMQPMPMPTKGDHPHLPSYVKNMTDRTAAVQSLEELAELEAVNNPTISKLPATGRKSIMASFAARRQALGGGTADPAVQTATGGAPPAAEPEPIPPAEERHDEPPRDLLGPTLPATTAMDDRAFTDKLVEKIRALKSRDEFNAIANDTETFARFSQLRKDAPKLAAEIDAAANIKLKEFGNT